MEDILNYPKDSPEVKAAIVTMRQSKHTHSALEEAALVRISHIRHTKGGGETSDLDHVFVELAHELFLKPRPNVTSSVYDNLHRTFIDKRSSAPYSLAPKPPLELPSRARHLTVFALASRCLVLMYKVAICHPNT
jgi:hypothetical protein